MNFISKSLAVQVSQTDMEITATSVSERAIEAPIGQPWHPGFGCGGTTATTQSTA